MAKKVHATGVLLAVGMAFFSGCASKKKPPVEPSSPGFLPGQEELKDSTDNENEASLERIKARITELFVPIYFDYDQSTLSTKARTTLGEIGAYMKEISAISVTVEGHADDRGTESYNLALGEKRAQTAAIYLKNMGVDETRISVISYGEESPAEDGDNEKAWAKNRRAAFRATL